MLKTQKTEWNRKASSTLLIYIVAKWAWAGHAWGSTKGRQQYIAVNGPKYKTAIKKPQIMLRTAPKISNIRNRFPARISRHQTFDIVAVFVGKYKRNLPPEKPTLALSLERESNTVWRCVRPWIKFTQDYLFKWTLAECNTPNDAICNYWLLVEGHANQRGGSADHHKLLLTIWGFTNLSSSRQL